MINRQLAEFYVLALTGSIDSVMEWRCIHDQRKDLPAHNYRGTIAEQWMTLEDYNNRGYGIFANINALDGAGRELHNVAHIRAHVVDLDNPVIAPASYDRAVAAGACFVVQSSPGKFHIYWRVQPYTGNEFYTLQQRRLAQLYDGDRKIIDPTRVMRVPGFIHSKGAPTLVNAWPLAAFDKLYTAGEIDAALQHVNVFESGISSRSPLGTKEMQAPSYVWLKFALNSINPNDCTRDKWLSVSAAFKQAGWTLASEAELLATWSEWCALYKGNDAGENLKLWNSINDTEVGWATFERLTTVRAYIEFGHKTPPAQPSQPAPSPPQVTQAMAPVQPPADKYGEILSENDCREWFKDCFFVTQSGKIFNKGRFMNATQFNGVYGGKQFIISSTGKLTDEAWKAATRSTCYTIPKVDHIRFLPDQPSFTLIEDELGRVGINTYLPARIKSHPGDVSMFLDWMDRIIPDKTDQRAFFDYMAHCIKYPGYKIPWSIMLQSCEGIGKTIFHEVMQQCLGLMYVYSPKAPELVKSGSTFNAWMRGKLMIVVDEIKIDERRELIEILKPMITEKRVEIQGKGVDQDMEDNIANWIFFSNYKDAIPINKNGRRYAIFYSILQSADDLIAAGMDDDYFKKMWSWLRDGGGLAAIAHWFLNYPLERGALPTRAPKTTSYNQALQRTRSPLECAIIDAIEDNLTGFKGGYISGLAVIARAKAAGIRNVNNNTVQSCLESMGYVQLGRAARAYMQEDPTARSEIYGLRSKMPLNDYGRAQGYE